MITELRVRDLVTVDDATLSLGAGLNVLTGETGAGKSMLVDALALLLGGRADAGAIRPGAAKAIVEGVFEPLPRGLRAALESLGLDAEDDRVVVRREVSAEGRSRAWVNGSPTTVAALEQLGGRLADLHGQDQTVSLLKPSTQRTLLDGYAGAPAEARAVAEAFAAKEALRRQEAEVIAAREAVKKKADYLRHVTTEIDAARIAAGEDERLEQDIRRLSHAEELRTLGQRIASSIDGDGEGALAALHEADRALGQLERIDPTAADWRGLVEAGYAALEELARSAERYAQSIEDDPTRLAELNARRTILDRLCQKYGGSVAAVLSARAEAAAELDLVDRSEFDLKALAAKRAAAEQALAHAARELSARRRLGGDKLARAVNRQLPKLGLAGGRFEVVLTAHDAIGADGAEAVQFVVQLNVGLEARPIEKAASGGELSRLMLALTVALARQDGVPTLVFDEIDAGVGGEVGSQVALALAESAERHQVLVITHLPTIAARADRHLVVTKRAKGGIATSAVAVLHGEDRVTELARMLGSPDSDSARRHAVALLATPARR
ncbi:MAG: DNA repair protein RecN [Gemmatimonadales bacterium]